MSVLRFIARFCLQKYDVFAILQSTREQQGNTGKNKEKTKGLSLSFFASILHFIISVLSDAMLFGLEQINTFLSCIVSILILLFGA
ncbi:hypothetical protein HMPREF9145_0915 [Segatella salivae F0493]|uniref:Uncharacterized protein n=1 Tax=Segatella salivae F0493 TaxID=1395125 RepID=U2MDB0_9BACT|nr:hypothetical protein HMPREF9145_0915 [Segatella salivae F0493]